MRSMLMGLGPVAVLANALLMLPTHVATGWGQTTIDACTKKRGGAIRILAPGKQCRRNETAISWSQVGPRGGEGAQGPAGTNGGIGPQGPAGPPGPSVSGFAHFDPGIADRLPSDGSFATIADLSSGTSTGPVTTTFPARFVVTGTARLQNGDGVSRSLTCRLVVDPGTPAEEVISAESRASTPTFAPASLAMTAGVDRPAGTYNFGVQCRTGQANPNGLYSAADLTVIATAR